MKASRSHAVRGIRSRLVRNAALAELQDSFLIASVATVLFIRLQLWLTNYPQISPGNLHIAHLLWGGVFMLISIGMLVSFVGRSIRMPAAIVGGIGFGFFIDEIGKFITADNNYFYKPAAALIYVIFVVLFLGTRSMQRKSKLTDRECLVNAVDLVLEAARHDFNRREKSEAIALLDRSDQSDPLVQPLRGLIAKLDAEPDPTPGRLRRFATSSRARYLRMIEHPRFPLVLSTVFVIWAVVSLLGVLGLVFEVGSAVLRPDFAAAFDRIGQEADGITPLEWGSILSSTIAAVLVWLGVLRLRHGERSAAYQRFDWALMVQVLLTEVFEFLQSQFAAVFGLSINIILLITVRYMINSETLHKQLLARKKSAESSNEPKTVE